MESLARGHAAVGVAKDEEQKGGPGWTGDPAGPAAGEQGGEAGRATALSSINKCDKSDGVFFPSLMLRGPDPPPQGVLLPTQLVPAPKGRAQTPRWGAEAVPQPPRSAARAARPPRCRQRVTPHFPRSRVTAGSPSSDSWWGSAG